MSLTWALFFTFPKTRTAKAAYFELYDKTARAVKKADSALRVGGPAVNAAKNWITDLIAYCTTNSVPLDLITFHFHGPDGLQGGLDPVGDKRYFIHVDPLGQAGSIAGRGPELVAKSAHPGLPIHVTEWNTSYAKHDHVHDSYYNAAIMLGQLREIEHRDAKANAVASVSRWTFTDISEEDGLPPAASGAALVSLLSTASTPPLFSPSNIPMSWATPNSSTPTKSPGSAEMPRAACRH